MDTIFISIVFPAINQEKKRKQLTYSFVGTGIFKRKLFV